MYYAKALQPARAAKLFFFQKNSPPQKKRLKPFTGLRVKALIASFHCDGRCLYP